MQKNAKLMEQKAGFAHLIGEQQGLDGRDELWEKSQIRLLLD